MLGVDESPPGLVVLLAPADGGTATAQTHAQITRPNVPPVAVVSNGPNFVVRLGETLALGQRLGLAMPRQLRIFALEVYDPFTVGTHLTPAVQQAIPTTAERVATQARKLTSALKRNCAAVS